MRAEKENDSLRHMRQVSDIMGKFSLLMKNAESSSKDALQDREFSKRMVESLSEDLGREQARNKKLEKDLVETMQRLSDSTTEAKMAKAELEGYKQLNEIIQSQMQVITNKYDSTVREASSQQKEYEVWECFFIFDRGPLLR